LQDFHVHLGYSHEASVHRSIMMQTMSE
jgi:hypothetical protein